MKEELDEKEVEKLIDEVGDGSLISLLSMGSEKVISLLFVFSVTNIGGAALYGVIAVLQQLLGFFGFFTGGPGTAAERTISRVDKPDQNAILVLASLLTLFFNLVIGFLFLNFDRLIFSQTVISAQQSEILLFFVASLLVNVGFSMAAVYMKAIRRIKIYNLFRRFIRPSLSLVFALPTLFFFKSASMLWLSLTASMGLLTVLSFYTIHRYGGFSLENIRFNRSIVDRFLSFTASSSVSSMMNAIQMSGFSIFMAVFLNPVQAGVFGVSLTVGMLSKYLLFSVNEIFPPLASELYGEGKIDEIGKLYKITSKLITLFSVPVIALTVVFYPEIIGLFSNAYKPFSYVLPIVTLGNFLAAIFGSVGYLLLMTDNERHHALLHTILTSLAVSIIYLFTVEYGLIGLASSYTLVFVLNNLSELLVLYRLEGLQPFTSDHLKFLLGGVGVVAISLLVKRFAPIYLSAVVFVILSGIYLRTAINILEDVEAKLVSRLASKMLNYIRVRL